MIRTHPLNKKIRENREDSAAGQRPQRDEPGILQMGKQHRQSHDGRSGSPTSMRQSWKECEGDMLLEVFSGSGRLSAALRNLKLPAFPIDVLHDPCDPCHRAPHELPAHQPMPTQTTFASPPHPVPQLRRARNA